MELSSEVLEALQLAADGARISDDFYKELITFSFSSLISKEKNADILAKVSPNNHGAVKEAYLGLTTLILEAAKHNTDPDSLGSILEDCKFTPDRIQLLVKTYLENKQNLRILLSSTGNNPPHVVDADWRLDYYMKNNHLDKVNQASYLIELKTEQCNQAGDSGVQFNCSMEQLQDLVGKLKDACKSLERAGQQ